LYECKSDYDIFAMIADKLALKDKYTEGKTELQWIQEIVAASQKADPNFPTLDEWRKKGVYIFKSDPRIPLKTFIDDPVKNALKTPTGKIELFSTTIWNEQKTGFVDAKVMPAIPKFQPEWEGGPWDDLYKKYPLQAFGHHYQPRSHSTYEEVDWLREAFPQRVFMNPIDAQARGLKDGDKVRVFNDRGQMMLPVRVTPRIIPGVVDIPQGAWWTPDNNKVDQRGAINVLTNYRPTPGSRGNPQHSNLVQVEKV
jgi:anaerobic dimethyl sulfoxide reductase subunit A